MPGHRHGAQGPVRVSWGTPQPPEPRPDTTAAGNALLHLFGSLALFGAFVVAVPGQQPEGRSWLWPGLMLLLIGAAGFARALVARIRYLRRIRYPRDGRPDRMSP
jgi:hypothetical protein